MTDSEKKDKVEQILRGVKNINNLLEKKEDKIFLDRLALSMYMKELESYSIDMKLLGLSVYEVQ